MAQEILALQREIGAAAWRSSSREPRSSSNSRSASVTVDCEMLRICDAEDTEPFSATATKYWSWRSEKAIDETGRRRMDR